jgi:hypothetical protein
VHCRRLPRGGADGTSVDGDEGLAVDGLGDADEDGVRADRDICPDGDDTVSVNANGIPDACE